MDTARDGQEYCDDCTKSMYALVQDIKVLTRQLRAKNDMFLKRTGVRMRIDV